MKTKTHRSYALFARKLHQVLSLKSLQGGISWMEGGLSWKVKDRKIFYDKVLPYMQIKDNHNFISRVNHAGFVRIKKGPHECAYYHEEFWRERDTKNDEWEVSKFYKQQVDPDWEQKYYSRFKASIKNNKKPKPRAKTKHKTKSKTKVKSKPKIKHSLDLFHRNLIKVLQNPKMKHILCWTDDNTAIVLKDKERLIAAVLPRFFNGWCFKTFMNNLNEHGFFRKDRRPGCRTYYHGWFQKDRILSLLAKDQPEENAEDERKNENSPREEKEDYHQPLFSPDEVSTQQLENTEDSMNVTKTDTIATMNFPQKIQHMLSQNEFSGVIRWMPHGLAFSVHDPSQFESEVLPSYFGARFDTGISDAMKFDTFTFLLYTWGFHRISYGEHRNAYYHVNFCQQEDNAHFWKNMTPFRARKVASMAAGIHQDEKNGVEQSYYRTIANKYENYIKCLEREK